MTPSPYTSEFNEYVEIAGCELRHLGETWVILDYGGETQFFLRWTSDGSVLTMAERAGSERFVMSAPDIADVERYMTTIIGSEIRSDRGLWFVYTPWDLKDVAPGWTVAVAPDRRWHLSGPDGRIRATFAGDGAVEFSWLADACLSDIRNSYLHPDGVPLFVDERWRSSWKSGYGGN
jgi:hypothetical protein